MKQLATNEAKLKRIVQIRTELTSLEQELFDSFKSEGGELDFAPPAIRICQDIVCHHFHLPLNAMTSPIRTASFSRARQIAMTICSELTKYTLTEIGDAFNRDHGTVIHAQKAVSNWCATDTMFAEQYKNLKKVTSQQYAEKLNK
jgi:chromosomal replication initiation ATPase DnaA